MEVKKRDLEEIFKNKTFDIPRYQRGYDWKKLNLDIFWNDLSYHVKHSQTLFLGTIILNDNDRKQEVHMDASIIQLLTVNKDLQQLQYFLLHLEKRLGLERKVSKIKD